MAGRFLSLSLGFALVAAAILLPMKQAAADAIDGNWCSTDGRNLSIDGPRIVTPGGTHLLGNYERHFFSYSVPAAEPGAGSTVSMAMINEHTVHLSIGERPGVPAEGPVQVWRRCSLQMS